MVSAKTKFTLTELIMAITIIAMLMALVIGGSTVVTKKVRESKCRAQIAQLETAMAVYQSEFGYYPQAGGAAIDISEDFVKGKSDGAWKHGLQKMSANSEAKYLLNLTSLEFDGGNCVDAYGHPYRYRCDSGGVNWPSVDLWSKGPDGVSGNDDDITNWERN